MSSAPQIFAPAAVNPSAWDFVGSGLGFGWDVLGSVWLSVCTQIQVDHLSNFQSEVDHLSKIEVDQEFKKIQVDHGSKFKTQVDLGFKKICIQMCNRLFTKCNMSCYNKVNQKKGDATHDRSKDYGKNKVFEVWGGYRGC
jgi:hypothetical protein